jgi:hypothetical protein
MQSPHAVVSIARMGYMTTWRIWQRLPASWS